MAFTISNKKKEIDSANAAKHNFRMTLDRVSLIQVVGDELSNTYKQVIGGYLFDNINTRETIKFKAIGDFTFVVANTGSNEFSPPLKIKVVEEKPISLLINDDGFLPKIVQIEEGTLLKWSWSKLAFPHSIYQAEYCDAHCGLFRVSKK